MKKLTWILFGLLTLSFSFQACDNTKTYAEMLEEEDDAIQDFINEHGIKVITQREFFAKDSVTEENEYVQLSSGVYMNIVKKGKWKTEKQGDKVVVVLDSKGRPVLENPNDTIKNNDEVLVRFMEYSIMDKDTTLSNLNSVEIVDEFRYKVTSSQIAGSFTAGYMYSYYGPTVPAGWLVPLSYIRSFGHVKLIVPSKMGHQSAMQYVQPYFYDIRKYQFK